MSTHLVLDFPGELMHSNWDKLTSKTKNVVLQGFATMHNGKPLQVGYNGGVEVGQVIGTRVHPDRVGLVIEWREDIEVIRQEGWKHD